jgi:hypothetical protein
VAGSIQIFCAFALNPNPRSLKPSDWFPWNVSTPPSGGVGTEASSMQVNFVCSHGLRFSAQSASNESVMRSVTILCFISQLNRYRQNLVSEIGIESYWANIAPAAFGNKFKRRNSVKKSFS